MDSTNANRFYITTPIYYPSGEPHLGHAYTTICADAVARFHRLAGDDTFFLTGTDEHGQKMVNEAEKLGTSPGELGTSMMEKFRGYFDEIGITNDDFIRTTEDRHKQRVTKIVEQMQTAGDIYKGKYNGWYDEGEEAFVTETDAKASDYKSPVSGRALTKYEEETYFFKLSKYVPKLIEHIKANPSFIQPDARRNKILNDLRGEVGDLSISRASLGWGVEMPGDPEHVLYVWIDALSNYITALGYGGDDTARLDKYWPADVHLIGKEIIWFHTVYWPAMLMSIDAPLQKQVFAHGWWVSEGKKMSKSLGNFVGLEELRAVTEHYGLDALRYYLLWAAPFGSDLDWQAGELHRSYLELANVVGNGLNRVLKMTGKYRDGVLGDPAPGTTEDDKVLIDATAKLAGDVADAYGNMRLQDAVTLPIELAREMNGYIDRTEPFKLAKDASQSARLDAVLYHAASAMRQVLAALLPVLPEKAAAGLDQLRLPATLAQQTPLRAGHQLGEGQPLFPRLDPMTSA